MATTFTTSSIARHFSVAASRLNQDLNSGYLLDCVPPVKAGQKRVWDIHAYIAAYFYLEFCDQGMSRSASSKMATAISIFHKRNPSEKMCVIVKRLNSHEVIAEKCSDMKNINEWSHDIQWASVYNITSATASLHKY